MCQLPTVSLWDNKTLKAFVIYQKFTQQAESTFSRDSAAVSWRQTTIFMISRCQHIWLSVNFHFSASKAHAYTQIYNYGRVTWNAGAEVNVNALTFGHLQLSLSSIWQQRRLWDNVMLYFIIVVVAVFKRLYYSFNACNATVHISHK